MGKATITISHGKSQSFSLTEGSNVKLAPSSDGKGVEISVDPSDAWINPGRATKEKDGLLKQLPDDDKLFLNGKGEWTKPETEGNGGNEPGCECKEYNVFGFAEDGLVPKTGQGSDKRWLKVDGTWSELPKYSYREVPHIVIDNIAALRAFDGGNSAHSDVTLSITANDTRTKTTIINGEEYYYNYKANGDAKASIFVLKSWCDKLLLDKYGTNHPSRNMTIMAGRTRSAGTFVATFYTKQDTDQEPEYINAELIKQFPSPTVFLTTRNISGGDKGVDVRERGGVAGWGELRINTTKIFSSYSGLPFKIKLASTTIKESKYPWLFFGASFADDRLTRDLTLSFSAIIATEAS